MHGLHTWADFLKLSETIPTISDLMAAFRVRVASVQKNLANYFLNILDGIAESKVPCYLR